LLLHVRCRLLAWSGSFRETKVSIVLSEPDHEPANLGIPATGQPTVDTSGAKPEKRALSRLFMFRCSESMHAKILALGGSKWLRSVIERYRL
jgi:hypothetical protein